MDEEDFPSSNSPGFAFISSVETSDRHYEFPPPIPARARRSAPTDLTPVRTYRSANRAHHPRSMQPKDPCRFAVPAPIRQRVDAQMAPLFAGKPGNWVGVDSSKMSQTLSSKSHAYLPAIQGRSASESGSPIDSSVRKCRMRKGVLKQCWRPMLQRYHSSVESGRYPSLLKLSSRGVHSSRMDAATL